MRKILVILTIFVITILGANYMVENYLNKISDNTNKENIQNKKEKEISKTQEKLEIKTKINVDNKIKTLRKRFELKGLIMKGDVYSKNKQHILALQSYINALHQNPQDKNLIYKLGNTYFEIKNFIEAYNNYKKLIGTDIIDNKKIALTYFFTLNKDRNKLDFEKIYKNITNFQLDKDNTFFYKTAVECVFNKDLCQDKFKKYSQYYAGKNQNILYIKKAFADYNAFKVKEQYFLDTQIVIALYKAKLYSITNILAKDILNEKKDYKPIIKILAKGYFEIGEYKEAKKYLVMFNKIDNTDPNIHYMLGIINIKLGEYILSNIYFEKAKNQGYKNIDDIYRRLIYNYYLVIDKKDPNDKNLDRMLDEFKNLITKGKELNETDYSLAIYYSLINGKKIIANKWTDEAIKKFPKSDIFYGYKGWIYKESNNYKKAKLFFEKGLKLNSSNPLINLNLGILEYKKGNILIAKIFLKNTIKIDPEGEFGKKASKELETILIEEEKIKQDVENIY